MISIIVPIYNIEQYLKKCVDSILNQNFTDYELILVDDGSTDKSGNIAQDYMNSYPSFITTIHKKNGGLGDARNVGIEKAQGSYLLFLDSDDYLAPNSLQILYQETLKTNADMYVFGFTIVKNNKVLRKEKEVLPFHTELNLKKEPRILLSSPSACNKLFKRQLFIETGIRFPTKVWYEDIRTITKIYCFCKSIVYLDICPYYYVLRYGSITKNQNCERNLEIIDAFEDILSFYKKHDFYENFKKELTYLAIYHLLIAASVRIIRVEPKSLLPEKLSEYMVLTFPEYRHNPYLRSLSLNKRIILYFIERKKYNVISYIFKIKNIM
ncbi:MAG: glycosyltransferase family 2 protein [Bacteroidales bacterium]|nr:glycosyltransferase family 2 protein [Bacteroidales bacterium]